MLQTIARRLIPLALMLGLGAEAFASPKVVVVNRPGWGPPPHAAVMVMPPRPTPTHLWVEGQWLWNGYGYAWSPGYWTTQPVYAAPTYYAQPARPVYVYRSAPPPRPVVVTQSRPVVVVRR